MPDKTTERVKEGEGGRERGGEGEREIQRQGRLVITLYSIRTCQFMHYTMYRLHVLSIYTHSATTK